MPTTIYMASGEEFTVTTPYAQVVEQWNAGGRVEFSAIWWTDLDGGAFDPLSDWPTYRESFITIDLGVVVAVEATDYANVDMIERARQHQLDQG